MKSKTNLFLLLVLFLFLPAKPVYAYLDPGSGSYMLQFFIAGVVGALFTVKSFWLQIKNFFSNLFSKKNKKVNPASSPKIDDSK